MSHAFVSFRECKDCPPLPPPPLLPFFFSLLGSNFQAREGGRMVHILTVIGDGMDDGWNGWSG